VQQHTLLAELSRYGFSSGVGKQTSQKGLMLLSAERAAFCKPGPAAGGLAEDSGAASAHHHSLGMAEHCRDPVAAGALHIHEIGVGVLDQTLQLVLPLFLNWLRVQQILRERHCSSEIRQEMAVLIFVFIPINKV